MSKEDILELAKKYELTHFSKGEQERRDGKTPNGGDYSVSSYYTIDDVPCSKKDAKKVLIVEYKSDGTYVNSVIGFLTQKQ